MQIKEKRQAFLCLHAVRNHKLGWIPASDSDCGRGSAKLTAAPEEGTAVSTWFWVSLAPGGQEPPSPGFGSLFRSGGQGISVSAIRGHRVIITPQTRHSAFIQCLLQR